ncbi:hypothetical protein QR98_0068950 [Sarcoptes scabiei]|uniref:Uncharacterized protein n=1 Tax=Sarcoptes scabiei TaxID=52283 RepID=A0A132ABY3_SARSC|nr:hypothetical protein QR98_0068950 [Sarcoptes scabiei]
MLQAYRKKTLHKSKSKLTSPTDWMQFGWPITIEFGNKCLKKNHLSLIACKVPMYVEQDQI